MSMIKVWDVMAMMPSECIVTIADSDGYVIFSGYKQNMPKYMRDMCVERLAPCHNHMQDFDYLWIEVL